MEDAKKGSDVVEAPDNKLMQLKAMAYDTITAIQHYQNQLTQINAHISEIERLEAQKGGQIRIARKRDDYELK